MSNNTNESILFIRKDGDQKTMQYYFSGAKRNKEAINPEFFIQ